MSSVLDVYSSLFISRGRFIIRNSGALVPPINCSLVHVECTRINRQMLGHENFCNAYDLREIFGPPNKEHQAHGNPHIYNLFQGCGAGEWTDETQVYMWEPVDDISESVMEYYAINPYSIGEWGWWLKDDSGNWEEEVRTGVDNGEIFWAPVISSYPQTRCNQFYNQKEKCEAYNHNQNEYECEYNDSDMTCNLTKSN